MVLSHPEVLPDVPRDAIALDWGYEADHPFGEECGKLAEAGLEFYVCPGTSSWLSIAGRTENMIANIRAAAEAGLTRGASGLLVTDWGDHGHWQPFPVSYAGLAYGAAMAWFAAGNRELDLAAVLDRQVFWDRNDVMGRGALTLGSVYQDVGVLLKNASALALLLLFPDRPLDEGRWAGITREGLERADVRIGRAAGALGREGMEREDAGLLVDEFRCAAGLLGHACRLGIARLDAGGARPADLPSSVRSALGDELAGILTDYRRLWLERFRPGGLADSAARLEALLARYLDV